MALIPESSKFEAGNRLDCELDTNPYAIKTSIWFAPLRHPQSACPAATQQKTTRVPPKPTRAENTTMATKPLDMDAIDLSMKCHSSANFTISCGTVTMDLETLRVLLIFNRKLQIYQLPKGRKHIGEGFLEAALRETYEETGYRAKPLPLKIATRATQPKGPITSKPPVATSDYGNDVAVVPKKMELTTDKANTEPLAMATYPDPQTTSPTPVAKMVFFYAATLEDSEKQRDMGTQDSHEDMDVAWVSVPKAVEMLRFKAEKDVVIKAAQDAFADFKVFI